MICSGFSVAAWQSPGCQIPKFAVLQSGRWSPKPGAVKMSAPRGHSASREGCLQLRCRSRWWSASALPRPLFPLRPCPVGGLGPPQPPLLSGLSITRGRCAHTAASVLLQRLEDLAEDVTRPCDSQVSREGGRTNPKALPPSSGPWAPRP